jgi:tripartite-type tricarboxylate transporter receptor subunit TctC
MITKFIILIVFLSTIVSYATENITIVSSIPATNSIFANWLTLVEEANKIQNKYFFRIEVHQGAQGSIALSLTDQQPNSRIALVTPAYTELIVNKKIKIDDYSQVFLHSTACWALISNIGESSKGIASLKDYKGKELVFGISGIGNSAHITGLMLSEKYDFILRPVVFKSNFEALLEMTANNTVNLVIEQVKNYDEFKVRNNRLQILGMSCPVRSFDNPQIKTLMEQGINAPLIFTGIVSSKNMDQRLKSDIEDIFERAIKVIGTDNLESKSFISPTLKNRSSSIVFKELVNQSISLQEKFKTLIEAYK